MEYIINNDKISSGQVAKMFDITRQAALKEIKKLVLCIKLGRTIFRKYNLCKSIIISSCFGQWPYIRSLKLPLLKICIIKTYVIILCIVIKWVCCSKRLGWRLVSFKLIYAKVVKYLPYHLIIINKSNNLTSPVKRTPLLYILQDFPWTWFRGDKSFLCSKH